MQPPATEIPEDRAQLIANLANDEWVNHLGSEVSADDFDRLCDEWERKTDDFLATVANPAELHLFAELWNWDGDDLATMRRVLVLPICEKATALLIFWRAQPEDYRCYASADDVPEHERAHYEFLREIERRYLQDDFAKGSLQYDPRADFDVAGPDAVPTNTKRRLPRIMYEPVA